MTLPFRLIFRFLFALTIGSSYLSVPALGQMPAKRTPGKFRESIVLVAFRDGTTESQKASILAIHGAREVKRMGRGVHVINVGPGRVQSVVQALRSRPEVRYAEPDFIQYASGATPNDTSFGSQWGLQNTGQLVNGFGGTPGADVQAVPAWSRTTGTNSVVVAVLDSGIQYTHPDLITNMWRNPGGVAGCPAGTHGFNVLNDTCDPLDDEVFFDGHGTHVAGLLGAVANNASGISGLAWTTSMMAVKWIAADTSGATSDLIAAIDWVIQAKQAGVNVRVVNSSASYSGDAFSQALQDAIDLLGANNILFVGSSGNTNPALNNDVTPSYPCSYNRPNQICVGALDQDGTLWVASNYGPTTVKLGAPGANILSTLRRNNYGTISGGSMAAPYVSATAALILSVSNLPVATLRSTILGAVDPVPSMIGRVETGGRLNACRAIPGCLGAPVSTPVNTVAPVVTGLARFGELAGAGVGLWSGSPSTYSYQWLRCNSGGTGCAPIPGATAHTYAILDPLDAGATLAVSVTASNTSGAGSAQSTPVAVATGVAPFGVTSTISNGSTLSGNVLWQATPAQAVSFVQFYIDGTLTQTIATAPYSYNQATTGLLDSNTLSTGRHVLGIRALSADNRIYSFTSAAVNVGSGPGNTALPVISGTPAVGQTLTTSNGTWTGSPTSFAYQWNRCNSAGAGCTPIAGATAASYVVTAADSNLTLRVVVTATNGAGSSTATSNFVAISVPVITTATLPGATLGVAYNSTLAVTGGAAPYTWSLTAGTLPAGLVLNASTGAITGTPTVSGTSNFTVQVRDSNLQTATRPLSITVTGVATGISLVQSAALDGTAVPTLSVPFTAANTAGNLIVVFVRMSTSTQTIQLSDTAGNVYATAVSQVQNADGHQTHIFYARNIVGGSNTVTATFSGANGHPFVAAYEYRGLSTTTPLDKVSSAQGSSAAVSTPAVTTASANELVFAGVGFPFGWPGTVSAGSGYTMQLQNLTTSRSATEAQIVSSTGSFSGSFGLSDVTQWTSVLATFTATTVTGPPAISTSTLPGGTTGSAYSATLAANGGVAPYTWSITAGALPAGLSLNASSGAITGTPTATGTANFTVQVRDANLQTATAALSITVAATSLPTVTTASLPGATQGAAYNATLAATGGVTPYTWSLTVGALPAGLTLNTATGAITGTPTGSGTSNFTLLVRDANLQTGTRALSIVVASNAAPTITTTTLPAASLGVTYNGTLTATGGAAPYTWSISAGTLPSGLVLNPATGAITGIPATVGTANFTARVQGANGLASTRALSIITNGPPAISTATLPNGTQGVAYNATLASTGGVTPYTWSLSGGGLPAGLSLSSSGVIAGTPTSAGTANFTARVQGANGLASTRALSITVLTPAPPILLVQSRSDEGSLFDLSHSLSFASNNTAGNLIVVAVRMSSTNQSVQIRDSRNNSYLNAVSRVQTSGGYQTHIFYARNIAGGSNTVTASFSGFNTRPWIAIHEFSGLSTTAPLDRVASAQGTGTSVSSGATATSTAGRELVFAVVGLPSGYNGSVSPGVGFTLRQQNTGSARAATETQVVAATGAYAGTFSLSQSTNWAAAVATFK